VEINKNSDILGHSVSRLGRSSVCFAGAGARLLVLLRLIKKKSKNTKKKLCIFTLKIKQNKKHLPSIFLQSYL
jgi:hypothetical protein